MFAVESQVILIYRHTNNSICLYKYNYTINNKRMQLKISNHYVFHGTQELMQQIELGYYYFRKICKEKSIKVKEMSIDVSNVNVKLAIDSKINR